MSGALNSVLGSGGSSSLLGDIGGLIGSEFGPIGTIVGQAIGNLAQQVVSGALNDAVDQLQQQQGLPPFLGSLLKDTSNQHLAENTANVPADAQQSVNDQWGATAKDLQNQLGSFIVGSAAQRHKSEASGGGGKSGSWLEAIAAAMGEALGKQASDLVALSNKMSAEVQTPSNNGTSTSTGTGTGTAATGTGAKAGASNAQGTGSNNDDAKVFNQDMAQFQALSQQYSILQNTFTTAIKSLGEALQGMARKN